MLNKLESFEKPQAAQNEWFGKRLLKNFVKQRQVKKQQQLIDSVKYLYPKAVYPESKADWDMGHRCLAYMEKALPLDKMILPSWLLLVSQHGAVGLRNDFSQKQFFHVLDVWEKGGARLGELRKARKSHCMESIRTYGVANCGELANVAQDWLCQQGQEACKVTLTVRSKNQENLSDGHCFVLYTADGSKKSFTQMINDLSSPNIRIVDLWAQKCGPAKELLDEYTQLLLCDKNIMRPAVFQEGQLVMLMQDIFHFYQVGEIGEKAEGQKCLNCHKKPIETPYASTGDFMNVVAEIDRHLGMSPSVLPAVDGRGRV